MDVETKNPRRTRTIIALTIAAAVVVSGVSNVAWAAAHPDEPPFHLSEVFE